MSAYYYDHAGYPRAGFWTKFAIALTLAATVALAYVTAMHLRQWRAERALAALPQQEMPVASSELRSCLVSAAYEYRVPPDVLRGIMRVEGGRIGQAVRNTNGTYDLGPMQINSLWVPRLARLWGVDDAQAWDAVRDNPCENIYIGAWILKQKVAETGTLYNGIAYYHSATSRYGRPYAAKVVTAMPRNGDIPPPPLLSR